MAEPVKRLSDAELEIMRVLWDAGGPVPSTQVRERLHGKRPWALSTLMTVLERLSEKGFVRCDRSTRTNLYEPTITEGEYKAREGRTVLEKLYGNSLKNLVASLYEEEAVGEKEILELRQYLEQLKEGRKPC